METTVNQSYYGYPPPAYGLPPGYPYAGHFSQPYNPWMNPYQDLPIGPMYPSGGQPNVQQNIYNLFPPPPPVMPPMCNPFLPPPQTQPPTPPEPPTDTNFGYDVDHPTAHANQQALQTVQNMLDRLGGGDGVLNRGEALTELNDTTGKYTDDEKAALRYMLTSKQNDSGATLWDAVGGADGVVGNIDFEAAKKGNMDPASIKVGSLSPF